MAPRLRRADPSAPGIRRRKAGRGFVYLDSSGARVTDREVLDRLKSLVVPPAWTDVWICTDPLGHIQATGVDARGRRQYRYQCSAFGPADLFHSKGPSLPNARSPIASG